MKGWLLGLLLGLVAGVAVTYGALSWTVTAAHGVRDVAVLANVQTAAMLTECVNKRRRDRSPWPQSVESDL